MLDSSIALAWCSEDEVTPETDVLLDRVIGDGGLVPSHWRLEIVNVPLQAWRRDRMVAADRAARMLRLNDLPIARD